MIRNDLLPHDWRCPKDMKEAILRSGGKNPFGEPMFRMILAETRITKACGAWQIWDDSVDVDDRGGINVKKAMLMMRSGAREEEIEEALTPKTPLRTDIGLADVRLYPNEGICLEKWKPAFSFGTPEQWESNRFMGMPALGPYPQHGDYELIAGPVPHMPSITDITNAISQNLRAVDERPASAKERMATLLNARAIQEEQVKRDRANAIEAFVKDGPISLRNRLSLGAGRVIQEYATKAGLTGHFGN